MNFNSGPLRLLVNISCVPVNSSLWGACWGWSWGTETGAAAQEWLPQQDWTLSNVL